MPKVTSKFQVTVPRAIAEKYGIRPGDEIDWVPAGDAIRVIPPGRKSTPLTKEEKLRLFDAATNRYRRRTSSDSPRQLRDRGWRREDLYARGRTR